MAALCSSVRGRWTRCGTLFGVILLLPPLGAEEAPAPATVAPVAAANPSPALLDRFRSTFAHTLDQSVRWVDGLFGEERYTNAGKGANGQLDVRTIWQEYQGIRVRTDLRASLPLDNISHRLNAIVGKGSTEDIIQDKNQNPTGSLSDKNNDWLVGLGYTPPWSQAKRITLQAGAILHWPPDPYVRANYRYHHPISNTKSVDISESVFWQESEQFGFASTFDFTWQVRDDLVLRFPNWAKVSDATVGAQYDSRVHLYQKLSNGRAMLYGVGMQGETGRKVPVRQYGVYMIYRQRMFRDWFAGELIAGGTMLRESHWRHRRFSPIVGVGFEMAFAEKQTSTESAVATQLLRPYR